jgi:hypothetical protein
MNNKVGFTFSLMTIFLLFSNILLSTSHFSKAETPSEEIYTQFENYYSIEGENNHPSNPELNAIGEDLIRLLPSAGVSDDDWAARMNLSSPREISNIACDDGKQTIPDEHGLSDFNWIWGQFITHDTDFTLTQNGRVNGTPETLNIPIPEGDKWMDPFAVGNLQIPMTRSLFNQSSSNDTIPREFHNTITGWLDGSQVYGSNDFDSQWLRAGSLGRMKVMESDIGEFLPIAAEGEKAPKISFVGFSASERFVAGDSRANEHSALTAMHVLFLREHNRIASEVFEQNPDYTDEEIYQIARKINTAQMQYITYFEYLPSLGVNLPLYSGFDSSVDPRISNEFSMLAFRMGHSQVNDITLRLGFGYVPGVYTPIRLSDGFWDPSTMFSNGGIDAIFRGAALSNQAANDIYAVTSLRNSMFGEPGFGGLDMCAIDIQRGRDHGLPNYNQMREYFGLDKANNWTDITDDSNTIERMSLAYSNPEFADPIMGMYAEKHVENSSLGPTMHALIEDQFIRLRDGDVFYFENDEELIPHLQEIKKSTLTSIILRNTDINFMQCNAMFYEVDTTNMNCYSSEFSEPYIDTFLNLGPENYQPEIINSMTKKKTLVDFQALDSELSPLLDWSAYGPTIAVGDCNDDGFDDIWIGSSFDPEGWETGRFESTGETFLFQNNGNGEFLDITIGSGLKFTNSTYLGASWADFDNDGDLDIYLSNSGLHEFDMTTDYSHPNKLFSNDGNCNFIDVTLETGLGNIGHSSTSAWADYDHDGDLDLHSANGGQISEDLSSAIIESDIFYKNLLSETGVATFIDYTKESGEIYGSVFKPSGDESISVNGPYSMSPTSASNPSANALLWQLYEENFGAYEQGTSISWASIFVDLNDDGFEDLFIATDFGRSAFYKNLGDGTFVLNTFESNLDEFGTGMGLDAGDIDGDGDLDICQTNFGPNYIYKQLENNTYIESSQSSGLNLGQSAQSVSWDCNIIDIDLDGDLDLWFASGNINPYGSFSPNSIYLNNGDGVFGEAILSGEIINPSSKTMGSSWGDFDLDGDLDLILGESNVGITYYENDASQRSGAEWIAVDVIEPSGIEGISLTSVAAKVDFEFSNGKTVRQVVKIGSGFSGSKGTTLHLGVPEGESIESITVKWNDGTEVYISQPDTNQYLEVDKSKQYDSNNLGEQLEEEIKIMPIIILVILASLFMYKLVLDSKRI